MTMGVDGRLQRIQGVMLLDFFVKNCGKCTQERGFDRDCRASTERGYGVEFDLLEFSTFLRRAIHSSQVIKDGLSTFVIHRTSPPSLLHWLGYWIDTSRVTVTVHDVRLWSRTPARLARVPARSNAFKASA